MSDSSKQTFFRQGGWMVMSTLISGVCMFAVHVFGLAMGEKEYGMFVVLVGGLMNLMTIPGLGLQTVFAQQAASAISRDEQERLAAAVQALLFGAFLFWLVMLFGAALFQNRILDNLSISKPVALWVTLTIALAQLWFPIVMGVLQGRQNFLWLGWALMINGAGRFVAVGLIVVVFGGLATGAIFGALIGVYAALLIGLVQSRSVWLRPRPACAFDFKGWLARVAPLTLGLGASQFIFSADLIVVRAIFGTENTGAYGAAGIIGRGLVVFTLPLAFVMFPKIVHNLSIGRKSNVLTYAFLTTLALGALAAIGCTALSKYITHVLTAPDPVLLLPAGLVGRLEEKGEVALIVFGLIPWFVWSMLPLALANVLLNHLLASRLFRVVPCLLLITAAYITALTCFGHSFIRVIQILGVFNLVFLATNAAFTWMAHRDGREIGSA